MILIATVVQLALVWGTIVAPDPEFSRLENAVLSGVGLVLAAAFLVPAIVINFRFARGRHLAPSAPTA